MFFLLFPVNQYIIFLKKRLFRCKAPEDTVRASKEIFPRRNNRHVLADIADLVRNPLGQIQSRHGIDSRLWPWLSALAVPPALGRWVHKNLSLYGWPDVAASVLRVRPQDRRSVIEAGSNDTGRIKQYAKMIRPDIIVVTSVGAEDYRSLGSLSVTCSEQAEMVQALPGSGLAVINGDDPNVRWMAAMIDGRIIRYGFAFSEIRFARGRVVPGEVSEPIESQGPVYRELANRIAAMAVHAVLVGGSVQRYAAGARKGLRVVT